MLLFECTLEGSGGALALTVTCGDSGFAGQTITCTDGTTTLTQTCPSSSPYTVEFKIPNAGIWTVSSTISGISYSESFTIPSDVLLSRIPEGETVTPTDDIQTWLHCANIWDKSYTTISEVLLDGSTVTALIASNNAGDYMARSTTWANDVCADSSAMTKIGANNYCADALLADTTWATAICNSTYFENVLNVKVPTMTSNTTPSGVVSGNVVNQYYAFDGSDSTQTQANTENIYCNVSYEFDQNVLIKKARIRVSSTGKSFNAALRVKDSSNNWQDLQSVTIPTSGLNQNYSFPNNNIISNTYQFNCTTQKSAGNNVFFQTIQLYGRASN